MGLMHRVLDFKTRGPIETLAPRQETAQPPEAQSYNDGDPEEVLVQVLQAIPTLEEGFSGLYQSFHLLRDLLAFDKLVLMGLTNSRELVFEPLINYGFDPSSLTKLNLGLQNQQKRRYTAADESVLQKLSSRDRELAEHPYYLIYLGLSTPWGALLGSGPFTRFQRQGTPVFGPVAQIMDTHIPRFLPKHPGSTGSIPKEQFSKAVTDPQSIGILELSLFYKVFQESYPDTVVANFGPLLRGWVEGFLPPSTLFTWIDEQRGGFFVPEIGPVVYEIVIRQLDEYLARSFLLEIPTSLGVVGTLEQLFSS
ncbi:MAG: hypothetical protein GW949_02030 [Spirochaetales bacterium]|nr:hypothetical protein [Spirochaetales bacterium]